MAENDMFPIIKDIQQEALLKGLSQASSNFQGALKRRRLSVEDFQRRMRSISTQSDYTGFHRLNLVVEAIVEDMQIKKKVLAEVEGHIQEGCLLATNTSSLSVEEMCSDLKHPQRFAGLHFFNPVHRMPLVEIISHSRVAQESLRSLYQWCLRVGKTPVVVKDGPGFLVNRILMPFLKEGVHLLEEGLPLQQIEKACLNFGMPMGPFRLLDEIGLDVALKVSQVLHQQLGERAKPNALSAKLVEKKHLGRKTGSGFYLHEGQKGRVNPILKTLIPNAPQKKSGDEYIQSRIFWPMVNEAALILQENIVETPQQVDLGLVFGIGFPPFRGGLLRHADSEGVDKIVDSLEKLAESVDSRFRPCDYLKNLKAFY